MNDANCSECLLPSANWALICAYLSKELTFDQFVSECSPNLESSTDPILGFISDSDVQLEMGRSERFRGIDGRGISFYRGRWRNSWSASLRISDFMGRIGLTVIPRRPDESGFSFQVDGEDWLHLLVLLAVRPLDTLFRIRPLLSDERNEGVWDELSKRRSLFDEGNNALYLQDEEDIVAWDVAINWVDWEANRVTRSRRCNQLRERWGFKCSENEFDSKFRPKAQLSRIHAGTQTEGLEPLKKAVREKVINDLIEKQLPASSRYESLFTKGGHPLHYFHRCSGDKMSRYPSGSIGAEAELETSGLWWWRSVSVWPEDLKDMFFDNWMESAFFYELAARLRPIEIRWPLFGTKWFDLDSTQRGVLYYIWPPHELGPAWLHVPIREDTVFEHRYRSRLQESVWRRGLNEGMKRAFAENRYKEIHLFGDAHPLQKASKGAIQLAKKRATQWGKRCELLEALDRSKLFGYRIENAVLKRLKTASRHLEQTCLSAGFSVEQLYDFEI